MVLEAFDNLKQFLEALGHLWNPLAISRRFAVLFIELWHFQNGSRGLWQFKTCLGRFKALVEAFGTLQQFWERLSQL